MFCIGWGLCISDAYVFILISDINVIRYKKTRVRFPMLHFGDFLSGDFMAGDFLTVYRLYIFFVEIALFSAIPYVWANATTSSR